METMHNNNNDETVIETWSRVGFLEGVEENLKEGLALVYDELANTMIENENFTKEIDEISHWSEVLNSYTNGEVSYDVFEVILFPMVRSVFTTLHGEVSWLDIKNALTQIDMMNFHKKNNGMQDKLKEFDSESVDYMAILTKLYADMIAAKIKIEKKQIIWKNW